MHCQHVRASHRSSVVRPHLCCCGAHHPVLRGGARDALLGDARRQNLWRRTGIRTRLCRRRARRRTLHRKRHRPPDMREGGFPSLSPSSFSFFLEYILLYRTSF